MHTGDTRVQVNGNVASSSSSTTSTSSAASTPSTSSHLFLSGLPIKTTANTLADTILRDLPVDARPLSVRVLPPKRRQANVERTRAAFLDFSGNAQAQRAKSGIEHLSVRRQLSLAVEFHHPSQRKVGPTRADPGASSASDQVHNAAMRHSQLQQSTRDSARPSALPSQAPNSPGARLGRKKRAQRQRVLAATERHCGIANARRTRREKLLSNGVPCLCAQNNLAPKSTPPRACAAAVLAPHLLVRFQPSYAGRYKEAWEAMHAAKFAAPIVETGVDFFHAAVDPPASLRQEQSVSPPAKRDCKPSKPTGGSAAIKAPSSNGDPDAPGFSECLLSCESASSSQPDFNSPRPATTSNDQARQVLQRLVRHLQTSHAGAFRHFLTALYPTTHVAATLADIALSLRQSAADNSAPKFRLIAYPPSRHTEIAARLQVAGIQCDRTEYERFLVVCAVPDHPQTSEPCQCEGNRTSSSARVQALSSDQESLKGRKNLDAPASDVLCDGTNIGCCRHTLFFGTFDSTWREWLLLARAQKSLFASRRPHLHAVSAQSKRPRGNSPIAPECRTAVCQNVDGKASDKPIMTHASPAFNSPCKTPNSVSTRPTLPGQRYILLDVDGVLHPLASNGMPAKANREEWLARGQRECELEDSGLRHDATRVAEVIPGEFHPPCMDVLRKVLLATGAKIILTSTWRETGPGRRAVDEQLIAAGISASVGCTPRMSVLRGGRPAEILAWVAQAQLPPGSQWVAVDDAELQGLPSHNFLHVDPATGLTDHHASKLQQLLLQRSLAAPLPKDVPALSPQLGVSVPSASEAQPRALDLAIINRAAHKVVEALWRSRHVQKSRNADDDLSVVVPENVHHVDDLPRVQFALDIGAAPGGWSHKLLTSGVAQHVIAVDPALLLPELLDPAQFALASRLHHVKARAEEAGSEVEDILAQVPPADRGVPNASANDEVRRIGVCVCDANVAGKAAVNQLIRPFARFFTNHCSLVLTVKLRRRAGSTGVNKHNEDTVAALKSLGFTGFHVFHLLSNTANERTLVAHFAPSPQHTTCGTT